MNAGNRLKAVNILKKFHIDYKDVEILLSILDAVYSSRNAIVEEMVGDCKVSFSPDSGKVFVNIEFSDEIMLKNIELGMIEAGFKLKE